MAKHDELFKLIKENPELEIVPMVDREVCSDDDSYSYWMGKWGSCKLDEYWVEDERIYFKEDDLEDLTQELIDERYDMEWKGKTDDEMEKLAEDIVNTYGWVKCIAVYIETP